MSRYLAAEVYAALKNNGCEPDGDVSPVGSTWVTRSGHVFMIPEPDFLDGVHWFDADVLDDVAANRWLGFTFTDLKRHP